MDKQNENAILNASEVTEDEDFDIDELEAKLQSQLEDELSGLEFLEEEREKIGNPDSLGKIIMDEVWTQFGNQIGLDMTNETLIQAYEREHPEAYSKEIGAAILKDERYQEAHRAMKQQQQQGTLVDAYTGQNLKITDKYNVEHVVPRKEIYDNARRKQSGIETQDLANKAENMVPINESLNKSKKDQSVQQYIGGRDRRETDLKKQAESAHRKIDESGKSDVEKRLEHEKIDKRLQDKLNANDTLMMEAEKRLEKQLTKT